NLRDCLALAAMPVSARQIFLAKSGALLLAFAVFVLAFNLPWAMLFAAVVSGHWQENPSLFSVVAANFAATGGACIFFFFSLLACQGVVFNVLPSRLFARASLFVQAAVFIATLGALPLYDRQPTASWWPAVWFLDLWEAILSGSGSPAHAISAMALPITISLVAYLLSYHRYRRLLLEGRSAPAAGQWTGAGSRLLES